MGKKKSMWPKIKPTYEESKLKWRNKTVRIPLSDGTKIVEPVKSLNHYVGLKRFSAMPGPKKKKKFRI